MLENLTIHIHDHFVPSSELHPSLSPSRATPRYLKNCRQLEFEIKFGIRVFGYLTIHIHIHDHFYAHSSLASPFPHPLPCPQIGKMLTSLNLKPDLKSAYCKTQQSMYVYDHFYSHRRFAPPSPRPRPRLQMKTPSK